MSNYCSTVHVLLLGAGQQVQMQLMSRMSDEGNVTVVEEVLVHHTPLQILRDTLMHSMHCALLHEALPRCWCMSS